MIDLIPIKVESYSGYKADEYPICFYLDNMRYEILEITDRWYQGYTNPAEPASDYFKVKTANGDLFIIKHDIQKDVWLLYK